MTIHRTLTRRACVLLAPLTLSSIAVPQITIPTQDSPTHTTITHLNNILYGVSYYHEYMPYERLDQDVDMMKRAGISVVRMGESSWSLWEPEDGRFEFAWMDSIIEAMTRAHIKVILGTPTYSIPPWLYKKHPEILARPLGGAPVFYGTRQNMDTDNVTYRQYAERLIIKLVEHYRDNPSVIGWQVDNETASYGASNDDVFQGFKEHLKEKFGSPENLDKAWFLKYWSQAIHNWDDLPSRDSAQSTGYKLEWSRWQQMRVTDFLKWQSDLVRRYRRSDQFVTQDFAGAMRRDVNEKEVANSLDVVAVNPYHATQDRMDGASQAEAGDFMRSLKHDNYLVTETNAQTMSWSSAWQYPPYDGQLRLNVYSNLASGANMVAYWHWHSIHAGQETYWKGVLGHDLEPNRAYAEVSDTGRELDKIGSHLVNLKIHNQVAILYSVDSANALDFMPFTHGSAPQWTPSPPAADYGTLVSQLHRALYDLNVGADFVFPEDLNFDDYKVLIVPALYIANDALLQRISDFVRNGGHVLMTFKSGFCNENSAVRWTRMPGPLREAAGFSYQEFSSIDHPLRLKGDPLQAGAKNEVKYWAEFLVPEHAKSLAYYDDTFFGRWPAITRNAFGRGTLTYEGTWLSDRLQRALLKQTLEIAKIPLPNQALPPTVKVRSGTGNTGHELHYYFNYSRARVTVQYNYKTGKELTTDKQVGHGKPLLIPAWGVNIVEEK